MNRRDGAIDGARQTGDVLEGQQTAQTWEIGMPIPIAELPPDTLEFRPTAVVKQGPPTPIQRIQALGEAIVDEMKAREIAYEHPRGSARAVAKAQRRVAELAGAADAWITRQEGTGRLELHKRGNRKLRRAMEKLERVKRAAK